LRTLFGFTYGARAFINQKLLSGVDDKAIIGSEYRVFWLAADVFFLHLIVLRILGSSFLLNSELVVSAIICVLVVYSVIWLKRRSLRGNVILSYLLMVASVPLVVLSQLVSVAFNVFIFCSTSPRYEGKVHYAPIKPY
jgi:hypothetical protein